MAWAARKCSGACAFLLGFLDLPVPTWAKGKPRVGQLRCEPRSSRGRCSEGTGGPSSLGSPAPGPGKEGGSVSGVEAVLGAVAMGGGEAPRFRRESAGGTPTEPQAVQPGGPGLLAQDSDPAATGSAGPPRAWEVSLSHAVSSGAKKWAACSKWISAVPAAGSCRCLSQTVQESPGPRACPRALSQGLVCTLCLGCFEKLSWHGGPALANVGGVSSVGGVVCTYPLAWESKPLLVPALAPRVLSHGDMGCGVGAPWQLGRSVRVLGTRTLA